ncbi:MAG: hypothetical protein AAFO74_15105 [Pseudomonadota bacterium]
MDTVAMRLRQAIYGLASLLILGAMVSGVLHYSPVPFWDMWDGGLNFLMRFEDTPSQVLFEQHNEHRIFWSRLLFLIDYKVFGGRHIFLLVINYAFAFSAWYIFWRCLKRINHGKVAERDLHLLAMVLGGWLFLWSQVTNFTWAFQSQFFLAQLVPLAAFLLLSKSAQEEAKFSSTFLAASVLGVVSAGTMANGALALPFMAVWAIVLRLRWWQVGILSGLAALVMTLYLSDYSAPGHHSSPLSTFLSHPFEVLAFVFKYLGNPLVHVVSPYGPGTFLAGLLGLVLTVSAISLTLGFVKKRPSDQIAPGLTLFIIYIGASAFLTAGSRVFMGDVVPFASRYTTPTVMAWAALICILSPWLFRQFEGSKKVRNRILGIAALLLVGMFIPLVRVSLPKPGQHHNRAVAMLALELGIHDSAQIEFIYPHAEPVLRIAENATQADVGVFGSAVFKGTRELIAKPYEVALPGPCIAAIDVSEAIAASETFIRLEGHMSGPGRRLYILNADNEIIGIALRGGRHALGKEHGFIGYVRASEAGAISALASDSCKADLVRPDPKSRQD